MKREKTKPCGECKVGKVMTNELQREFNAKDDKGRQICPDCKVKAIYAKFRR